MELYSGDVFMTFKNAQDADLLSLLPSFRGRQGPGKRFFESVQKTLLEQYNLEQLDKSLYNLAPVWHFMADPGHWEPQEFTASEFFQAIKNLQTMGVFDITDLSLKIPGDGDRFFEYYQRILVDRIGTENLDRILFTLGQCIRFLATEEAMENITNEK